MSRETEMTVAFGDIEPYVHFFEAEDVPPRLMDLILATSPLLDALAHDRVRAEISRAIDAARLQAIADYAAEGSCAALDVAEIAVLDPEPRVLGPAFELDLSIAKVAGELSVRVLGGPSAVVEGECPTKEYLEWLAAWAEFQSSLSRWMASMPHPTAEPPTPPEEFDGEKFQTGRRKRRIFTVRWYVSVALGPVKYQDTSSRRHTVWTRCCADE